MSPARPSLDVVIVNWNAGEYLRDCVHSISPACTDGFELNRVVVVDNASSDGSADRLEEADLPLVVIRNPVNRGFAAACNQGALSSDADYLLFLNPDTRLTPSSLQVPIRFMEYPENAKFGICGIKLLDENGEMSASCARFPSLGIFISKIFGLSKFFPTVFPHHLMSPAELRESREVDQVIGAFFLIRNGLFRKLNGFDERFFVYYEEVDLSFRAKREGTSTYYLADATASHIGRISSRQNSGLSLYYSLSSRLKYARKNFRPWEAVALIVFTVCVEFLARMGWSVVGSSVYGFHDTLAAYKLLVGSLIHGGSSVRRDMDHAAN